MTREIFSALLDARVPEARHETRTMPDMALLDWPLEGTRRIEASAGTGKTFALALLHTRLIVERELPVKTHSRGHLHDRGDAGTSRASAPTARARGRSWRRSTRSRCARKPTAPTPTRSQPACSRVGSSTKQRPRSPRVFGAQSARSISRRSTRSTRSASACSPITRSRAASRCCRASSSRANARCMTRSRSTSGAASRATPTPPRASRRSGRRPMLLARDLRLLLVGRSAAARAPAEPDPEALAAQEAAIEAAGVRYAIHAARSSPNARRSSKTRAPAACCTRAAAATCAA